MPDIKMITRRKAGAQPVARARCDEIGVEYVIDSIASGVSMTQLAREAGVSIGTFLAWLEDDADRSARVRTARVRSAKIWDEKAEQVIEAAPDKFELERARELAHHYRWRAKAIAPRDYGDKVQQEHTGAGGGPIAIAAVDLRNLSDAELENMNLLMSKASGTP
jgi:AcrR family transcriptional regulator